MKTTMMLLAALILTVAMSSEMLAQNGKGSANAPRLSWVDANNDGICDNYTGTPKQNKGVVKANFVDADGDGVCDNQGTNSGRGKRQNFVDADGDGVCDNAGTATATSTRTRAKDASGTGTGNQNGRRGGK